MNNSYANNIYKRVSCVFFIENKVAPHNRNANTVAVVPNAGYDVLEEVPVLLA